MRLPRFSRTFAAATLLAAAACDSGTSTGTGTSAAVSEFSVSGITVIHKPISANDVVTALLCIKGGAAALTPGNAGIERLYLNAMTHGTAKYDKDAFAALATSSGTSIGGQVQKDFSVATMRAVRQNLDDAWDLFSQAVMHPMFPESEVRLVRRQIAFTLRQRTDDPDSHLELLSDSVFYQGHPYAVDEEGTPESINRLTALDLAEWQRTRLTKANLMLVVVGNVSRADLEKKVAETFGTLPSGPKTAADVPHVNVSAPSVTVVTQSLPTNYVMGSYVGPGRAEKDYPAFALASRILSERLFEEVRTKRNLTYAVGSGATAGFIGTGMVYVTAVNPDTTLKVMLSEVRKLQSEPVPPEFVQEVLNTFATAYWMAQETNMGQAMVLAEWELSGGGWKNAFTYPDRLKAVTPADIKRVATQYIKNARFVVIGDPSKVDKKLFMSL